jgi:predicted transcriptional regulator
MTSFARENADKIYEYIRLHPGCTMADMERDLGMWYYDFHTARKLLGKQIRCKRVHNSGCYYLTEVKNDNAIPVS